MSPNDRIAELAYRLWNARGRPHGSAEQDWLEAERQFATAYDHPPASEGEREGGVSARAIDESLEATFPASDPAASHTPDEPPSNADDKWRAAGRPRRGTAKTASKTTAVKAPTPSRRAVASSSAVKTARSSKAGNPPVDESDEGPPTAPGDTGEG